MKFSLYILLGVVCIAIYLIGWHEGRFSELPLGWIGTILLLTSVHFLAEPLRWQVYLGEKKINRWVTFYHVFSSTALFSYILPAKLGLPLRYFLIARFQRLPATTVGLYMAIDSALGLLLWTAFSLVLGSQFVFWLIAKYMPTMETTTLKIISVLCLLSLLLISAILRQHWRSWQSKLRTSFSQVKLTQLTHATVLFILDIIGYVVRHAAILMALAAPFIGWQAIAASTVLSIYAGFLCMLPMGLVGYDAVMILLLTQYGVAIETAIMVPLVNRSASLLLSALLGVPSSLKLGLGINKKSITAMMGSHD